MVGRKVEDSYTSYRRNVMLINIIEDKYFADEISKVETLFEQLRDEPTKKSQCLRKCIIYEFSRNIKVLYK